MSALLIDAHDTDKGGTANGSGRKHQARSLERRRRILAAGRELVTSESITSLSLYDVARVADIPPSSVYHFFPKLETLLQALSVEVFEAFDRCIDEPIEPDTIRHWSDIGHTLEQRMQDYYRSNAMARALILGQHLHSDILVADHQHDDEMGRRIQAIYAQFYQLPPLPESYNIFAIALQVADKVYAMSHQEYGNITDTMAREGWRAAKAYLSLYLPAHLPRRDTVG